MVKASANIEKEISSLKIEYEPEVDILNIYFKAPETALNYSSVAEPGVILNYTKAGNLASIEVLDAARRYPAGQLIAASVDEFIDLKTASEISGIAPVTLRTQAEKGRLWAIRLAGQWLTTRDRLGRYVETRSKKGK